MKPILTDPDGIDDLIGGTLKDAFSGTSYGAFVTSAQEGAYTLTLTWTDLKAVEPIYTVEGVTQRHFQAEFYDQAGNRTSEDVAVTLACSQVGRTACAGECVELDTHPDHCGDCHQPIPPQGEGFAIVCRAGVPACHNTASDYMLCDDVCVRTSWNPAHCNTCGKVCVASDLLGPDCRYEGCIGGFISEQRTTCQLLCPLRMPGSSCSLGDNPGRAWYGYGTFDFEDVACAERPPTSSGGSNFRELHCYCVW